MLFSLLFFSLLLPAAPIAIDSTLSFRKINVNEFEIFHDPENLYSYQNILADSNLQTCDHQYIKNLNDIYWTKYSFTNNEQGHVFFFVEIDDPHHSSLQVYDDSGVILDKMGMGQPFSAKLVKHKNFLIPILLKKGESKNLIIRYKSNIHSALSSKLWSPTILVSYVGREYFYLGVFYGVLIIMGLYNLFLYFQTKRTSYIHYFLYVFSAAFYAFQEDGLGFQFVWPFAPWFNRILNFGAPILLLLSFLSYARSMVNIKKDTNPNLSKVILASCVLFVLVRVLSNFVPVLDANWFLFFIVPFALLYYWVLEFYVRGQKDLRLFLIGFSVMFSALFIQALRFKGWVPSNLFTVYVFNLSLMFEAIMFSYALGDKFRITHEQKERVLKLLIKEYEKMEVLKDQVNRELEQKVSERTTQLKEKNLELMDSNEKLEQLKEQLYQMNAELDKANWKLQKKVHSTTVSLIAKEKVSFDEFLKIYPNPKACFHRLAEMKWQEGFKCRKCGNDKYSVKSDNLARKCTRCKTVESVTADTLFHALKFPLNKAWYLAYVTVNYVGKGTIEQLAEELEIGKNACAHFRKKVQDRMHEKGKTGSLRKGTSWEDIILNDE